jgi:glycyl-tRNA synthetase
VREENWEEHFEHWRKEMRQWITDIGIDYTDDLELEVSKEELAHYSKRTIDFMYDFPFGRKELYGLSYRTDFDLKNHFKEAPYTEEGSEPFYPHVIEPTFGIDRMLLVSLLEAYTEEDVPTTASGGVPPEGGKKGETEKRIVMKFPKALAPIKAAVLPLSKKEELSSVAKDIATDLRKHFVIDYDETQSIGKRYRRQDEIGTPYCITVDFDSLEDKKVTVRERDSMKQERVAIAELSDYLSEQFA